MLALDLLAYSLLCGIYMFQISYIFVCVFVWFACFFGILFYSHLILLHMCVFSSYFGIDSLGVLSEVHYKDSKPKLRYVVGQARADYYKPYYSLYTILIKTGDLMNI